MLDVEELLEYELARPQLVGGVGEAVHEQHRDRRAAQLPQPSHDATLATASELLDLPLRLYEHDRQPTLVVFDEFQDLLTAGATLDGGPQLEVKASGQLKVTGAMVDVNSGALQVM